MDAVKTHDGRAFLAARWQEAGICRGDMLLLHSNIRRTLDEGRAQGFATLRAADVLDSLLDALGEEGTLLLPLFNFDFTRGVLFDICHTPSHMGALTEIARQRNGAVRTGHPIYSFCALGRQADAFRGVDNHSGYGADSPFGILRALGGKIGVLDLEDQNSQTFYHHVEEMLEVDYRYHKTFTGPYKDAAGVLREKSYSLFVRNLEKGVLTHVNPAGERMWQEGLYHGDKPASGHGLRWVEAEAMFGFVSAIIRNGEAENTLYRIEQP